MPITPVTHPRSAVRGKVPSVDALLYGQIAVGYHYAEPTLWVRNTRDEVVAINPQATTSVKGMAEIATRSQALAGTNNTTIITPKRLAQVLQELALGGNEDGGDANGNTIIDGGGAVQNVLAVLDGGFA